MERTIWDSDVDDEMGLDYEMGNLAQETEGRIICIADLGLWDGRKSGYRFLGDSVNEIFKVRQGDRTRYFGDGRNVRCVDIHHDGTNKYLFRIMKPNVDEEKFTSKIYNGTCTSKDITRYTKSLYPVVADVYGWK